MPYYSKIFHPGEVVLIFFQDKPSFFARVETVEPDVKKGWWSLTFLSLTIPLQTMTWTLDDDQMHGANFTMNKNPIRIERVETPEIPASAPPQKEEHPKSEQRRGRVISMFDDEDQ